MGRARPYIEDGVAEIANKMVERAIRPARRTGRLIKLRKALISLAPGRVTADAGRRIAVTVQS